MAALPHLPRLHKICLRHIEELSPEVAQGRDKVGFIHAFFQLLRHPRRRRNKQKRQSQKDSSFSNGKRYPAEAIDGLKEKEFRRMMQEQTHEIENKVDNEKQNNESDSFEENGRDLPITFPQGCYRIIITDCHHETKDESQQRKALAKKPSEVTSQGKEEENKAQD